MNELVRLRGSAAILRRNWLSVAVIVVGAAWMPAEEALRAASGDAAATLNTAMHVGLIAMLAIGIVIHGRRRDAAGRLLVDSERQLRRLMRDSPEAMALVRDGVIVDANPAIERLFGLPRGASLHGCAAVSLVEPDERAEQALRLASLREVGHVGTAVMRARRADGTTFDAEVAGVAMRLDGAPATQLVVRDVSVRRAEERALEASERQLRGVLDNMGLIALSVAADGSIRFANRATCELFGRDAESMCGTSVFELLAFPDADAARRNLQAAFGGQGMPGTIDFPIDPPAGVRRSIRWHLALSHGEDGGTLIAIGEDMTDAVESSDRLRMLLARAPVGICVVDAHGAVRVADGGPFALAQDGDGGSGPAPAHLGDLPAALADPLRLALSGSPTATLLQLEGRTFEATFSTTDGTGARRGAIGVFVEVTQRARLEREGDRLATAIDQAMDAIVITDAEGVISYVNPAFERVTGYSREEALGRRPSILKSGVQTEAFYASLWRTITSGRPWTGELVNRHKDGSLFRELATITPVRDRDGTIVSFVAVKRDVTRERSLEDELDREVRERAAIVTALERIAASGGPAEIAMAICEEVIRLPEVDMAAVFVFRDGGATTLAFVGPPEVPVVTGEPLPRARAEYLETRAAQGPWAEPWRTRREDGGYGTRMEQAGVQSLAYVPLRDELGLFGVLGFGTFSHSEAGTLLARLPALGAVGAMASSQLSSALRRTMAEDDARSEIERVIANRPFSPVYQPIVDLRTGEPLGYEALTRFADDARPDAMFSRARTVDLGVELELVTLEAAIADAALLPAGAFLSLNMSPELMLRRGALAAVLRGVGRPIVLEITEHAVIEDYAALREVARTLPVPARLAVDDAGAGFASLRHVLELAPDIVKIDRSITEHIDRDPARQALLAGLRFFASRRRIDLIAEGVETAEELAALGSLAVPLGQGWLLGRPARPSSFTGAPVPLPTVSTPVPAPSRGATQSGRRLVAPRHSDGAEPDPVSPRASGA